MKKKEVLVLGAGIVGVSTALALQSRGHHVVLLDRQAPGLGASYGNAGIIQREAVQPYGFPRDLPTLARAALGRDNAIRYHAGALPKLLGPLLHYWRNSAPRNYAEIAAAYSTLVAHSIAEHAPLIEAAGATHLIRKQGWHQAYRTPRAFERAAREAERVRDAYGLSGRSVSAQELGVIEPALLPRLAGSVLWQDPWTVANPAELVALYANLFVARGGAFVADEAWQLTPTSGGWSAQGATRQVSGQEAVIAMGAWSFDVARKLGYALPMFVKRGYHRHFARPQGFGISLLDAENGIMLAPMQQGLRMATGAELAPLGAAATPVQIARSQILASELVALGEPLEQQPWMGARPCSADMKPLVGPAYRHKGLWFHFGHGHQGLTLGPASARLLAEQFCGEPTLVPAQPFLPSRFARRGNPGPSTARIE